jgi:hypothetical protein
MGLCSRVGTSGRPRHCFGAVAFGAESTAEADAKLSIRRTTTAISRAGSF